jgi:hypothetical protein
MPARRTAAGRGPVLGLALAALLTGCVASPPALPDGVTAVVMQQRSDVAERMAELRIHNGSEAALAFTGVRLDDSRFASAVQIEREVQLEPGATSDLRFALPEPACDGGEVRRTLTLTGADGSELVADLSDADDVTVGLHERECLLVEVERTARLAWTGFTASPPGEPATALLTATPTGEGDPVLLAELRSTNLVRFAPKNGDRWRLGLALDAGSLETTIEVPLVPQRCDPHVVQEDKRGTIFTIEVAEPRAGTVEVPMPVELKAQVLTWVADWCRFGQ